MHGAQGIPGSFTFSANGVSDVVGFIYGWNGDIPVGSTVVPADQLGGSATVTLAPPWNITNRLTVASVDRAGNRSQGTNYDFRTSWGQTSPIISTTSTPSLTSPFPVRFAPGYLPPGYDTVVSYTYKVNDGPQRTVPAGSDGTVTVDLSGDLVPGVTSFLYVHSTSSNGWASPTSQTSFYVAAPPPTVSSDIYPENGTGGGVGQTGTFTVLANLRNSTNIIYSFDNFDTWDVAPVGPDGTATVTWTPDAAGSYQLMVVAQTDDGATSDVYTYSFTVSE